MALFWIKVVVFLDFFAVSLVVPLLSAYFRDAGVDTKLYGLITSLYSVSQLFGGVAMGIMSDIISKRDVLLLSFAGSAVSYLLVGTSTSTYVLFGSRILVGLVKQTMTVSTSAISELTEGSTELRSKELGRLSAISTASFIVGPSMGSILYRMDKRAPAVVAAACFVINMIICMVMMPQTGVMISTKSGKEKSSGKEQDTKAAAAPSSITQFLSTVKDVAQIPGVLTILSIRILVSFLESGTSSKLIVNYYEGRFGVQTYQLGFMSTAWALLSSLAQTFLVVPSTRYFGNDWTVLLVSLMGNCTMYLVEALAPTFQFYVMFSMVPGALTFNLLAASTRALLMNAIPTEHVGKCLGVLNVMTSGVGILAPLYGSQLFAALNGNKNKGYICSAHHLALALLVFFLAPKGSLKMPVGLRGGKTAPTTTTREHKGTDDESESSASDLGDDEKLGKCSDKTGGKNRIRAEKTLTAKPAVESSSGDDDPNPVLGSSSDAVEGVRTRRRTSKVTATTKASS